MHGKYIHRFLLFLLLTCWLKGQGHALPQFTVTGSHYEVGQKVGQQFGAQIRDYYNNYEGFRSKVLPYYNTPDGYQLCQSFLLAAETRYPQYVEELHGLAEGANLPFIEVFLMNLIVEIQTAMARGAVWDTDNNTRNHRHRHHHHRRSRSFVVSEIPHCSDIHVNHPDAILVGHNEDANCLVKERAYLLHATITDDQGHVTENFTAYTYPGVLSGNAFAYTNAGLFQTVNALYPKLVVANRTGRYILTRALLAAKNVTHAQEIITDEGSGAAYGFSVNLGKLSGPNSPQLWNFEVAPTANKKVSLVNSYQIKSSSTGNYFHVNKYRRMSTPEVPDKIISSIHRTRVIQSYHPPGSESDVRTILGDTSDPHYPIYRTPRPTDSACTDATALFNVNNCHVLIYLDNPGNSSGPVYNLPLSQCRPSGP